MKGTGRGRARSPRTVPTAYRKKEGNTPSVASGQGFPLSLTPLLSPFPIQVPLVNIRVRAISPAESKVHNRRLPLRQCSAL